MGFFSKKVNKELFEILEADEKNNEIGLNDTIHSADRPQAHHALTVDEVMHSGTASDEASVTDRIPTESPLEALKKRMKNMSTGEETAPSDYKTEDIKMTAAANEKQSLLEKCKPYIVDETGKDATTPKEPLYRLESVAEILQNDSQRTIDLLSQKYDIMIDDLDKNAEQGGISAPKTAPLGDIVKQTPPEKPQATPPKEEREVYEESLPEITVKQYQTSLPDISDIDNFVAPKPQAQEKASESATIRFTPIKSDAVNGDTAKVMSITNTIDLTNELGDLLLPEDTEDETTLEESAFDGFSVEEEYNGIQDAKKLIYKLSKAKRNSFLRVIGTVAITVLLCFFELPTFSNLLLTETRIMMAICTGIFSMSVIINSDMFGSFAKFLSKKSTSDVTASLASLGCLLYSGFSIFLSHNDYELCLLASFVLTFRAIGQFMSRSTMLGNLKQISTPNTKKAIALIMDEATTFAMAKDAIEGDVLIAAPRETNTVADFMKYSKFGLFMKGKLPFITVLSLILAAICGLAAASLFGEAIYGIYTAAAVLTLVSTPIIFLIETLPLRSSSKKLNRKGAMIAGKTAAERLEMANAVVLTSNDLFPSGTVTLHNMKVLSDNPIDDTIVKAASLTDAVNSPLSNIFKQIAGTNAAYSLPDSDTVKYEDKMGLSGWVDDELLFVGNRTLMEAHGISVPDVKIDWKILEKGYFPVYIASGNKAMALVVVQYSADPTVVYELKRITDGGVTLLVNNCDPNITAEMICDYLGLYEDSVRIMTNAGVHMYKNALPPVDSCSAPASFKGRTINFISVINSAAKIKKSCILLNVLYVLAICFGLCVFAYLSFSGSTAPVTARTLLLFELGITAATLLIYQAFKP